MPYQVFIFLLSLVSFTVSRSGRPKLILLDTSRYWYNYRHAANVVGLHHLATSFGVPESDIIILLAEDAACNARNRQRGCIFLADDHQIDAYEGSRGSIAPEVDYRGDAVTTSNFLSLLTGRHSPFLPQSRRLALTEEEDVFIYLTGHSGVEFVKFQDWEETPADDLSAALQQMWDLGRYGRVWWLSDTCKAATLHNTFTSPEILGVSSSGADQNSYSHHVDRELGVAAIDRFTHYALQEWRGRRGAAGGRLQGVSVNSTVSKMTWEQLRSVPDVRTDLTSAEKWGEEGADKAPISEFLTLQAEPSFLTLPPELPRGEEREEGKGEEERREKEGEQGVEKWEDNVSLSEVYWSLVDREILEELEKSRGKAKKWEKRLESWNEVLNRQLGGENKESVLLSVFIVCFCTLLFVGKKIEID